MQVLSEPANFSEKPATVNEDSDERKEPRNKPQAAKKKLIKKKNKSKTKETEPESTVAQTKTPSAMAPFGIFQSETQKCQRLEHYLRKDIENFYKQKIEPHEHDLLDNILNCNLVQLTDVHHKCLDQVWREKICSLSQIRSYLEIVDMVNKSCANFCILCDENSKKQYIYFPNNQFFHEISQFQSSLLQKRKDFLQLLKESQNKFENRLNGTTNTVSRMSQLSVQITFLFKSLYDSTKLLKNQIASLKCSIQRITQAHKPMQPPAETQSRYVAYLIKKLVLNSLKDEEIDYLNFFKNNELIEHNYGPPQASLSDQKQFQQFMRKKKNKKGKKGKYALHSACLGCCSSYYEQYNPFSYCQECYVRFHRSCYSGFTTRQEMVYINPREQKDVLCQSCYNKKTVANYKMRCSECDYCGLKGLISVPAGPLKRIHIFCMLLNGLWTVNNSKLEFKSKTGNKVPTSESLKCTMCHSGAGYLHFCSLCEKYVHASCAYFNGWKIDAEFDEFSENVELRMICCGGVPTSDNEKRRKFVTNYKKQAYSF